jgi:hypothetical protein
LLNLARLDVQLTAMSVVGLRQFGQNRSVVPDPVKGLPDEPI